MAGNPFGKMPGGMAGLANKMMQQAAEMEAKLGDERVEGTSGGGAVKVIANGKGDVVDLTISKEVVDPNDVEMLQDLVLTAVREAVTRANALREERVKSVIPPGFNIPGLA